MAAQFLSYMKYRVHVGVLGQALDVFSAELMADPSLDPTQCGPRAPAVGTTSSTTTSSPTPSPRTVPTGLTATAVSGKR